MFDLRHNGVHFGPLDEVNVLVGVTFLIILFQLCGQGTLHNLALRSVAAKLIGNDHVLAIFHGFTLSTCYKLWEVCIVIFAEKESLFVSQKIFLVVVF